jgi:hypothetical protein
MSEGASLFQPTGKYCSVETQEKKLLFKKIHLKKLTVFLQVNKPHSNT